METQDKLMADVTIEQAKHLIKCLEEGNVQAARETIDGLSQIREASLFCEVGKLTRQLHEALSNFQLDDKIAGLAAHEIPDAKDRLNYVITTTENAANKTMDSVEQCLPISENIRNTAESLLNDWERLYRRELKPGEFRELASRVEEFLKSVGNDSNSLSALLTDVLVAQDYQDLTGQVIRKVITLVQDVEENLVALIKMFGRVEDYQRAQTETKPVKGAEGPIIDQSRDDVLTSQDDVDDLLSSLGF
ncbi:protein phosphatase CheZ [Pleionea litopenaei]|uniref:Protein phosphatase CheZ n=1 Tax=Pleionea litopenaei TaxID=3070815 RepID=A0AA51RUA0_9GAMM|nr:protein phosphatase CheZ [Pleionea sp. HL-JVS1]WMS87690.1 protein phosphatase CheZ [Pleionea sp. HL-JVS1]